MLYSPEELVEKIPVFEMKDVQTKDGREIKTRKAIFSDRGEFIEIVSDRYNLLQPREVLRRIVDSGRVKIKEVIYYKGKFIYKGLADKNGEENKYKVVFRNSVDRSNSFMILIFGRNDPESYAVPLVFTKILHTSRDINEVARRLIGFIEELLEHAEKRENLLEELKNNKETMDYLKERVHERYFRRLKDRSEKERIRAEIDRCEDLAELYKTVLMILNRNRRKEYYRQESAVSLGEFIITELEKANIFAKI